MLFLARKNLLAERTRFALSIGGVAFSVLLILILGGLYRGWQTKLTAYLQRLDADFVIGQAGSADTTHSMSFLPATTGSQLEQLPNVTYVDEFIGRQIMVSDVGKDFRVFLVGYDPSSGRNAPAGLKSGSTAITNGQIVIDEAFSRKAGYRVGDAVPIAGQTLTVAGISSGGNSLIYQYVYVTEADARQLLQTGTQTNYFLVKTANPSAFLLAAQTQFPDLNIMTKDEFIANNKKLVTETFLPIVGILFIIAFLVGTAIIGLTIYTATVEKSREYGVLKAIGASNATLYRIVLAQSFLAGVTGFVVGSAASVLVSWVASTFVSGFISSITFVDALGVFVAAMAMAFIAAWIPARRVNAIDPALVFKS